MYGKNRHTHQSAKLQTIIYNAICNLFIDPILVCSGVRTFYTYVYMYRLYFYYVWKRTVQCFNARRCSPFLLHKNVQCAMHGSCYSCGIKCILYVSISLTPALLLSFGMLCDYKFIACAFVHTHTQTHR